MLEYIFNMMYTFIKNKEGENMKLNLKNIGKIKEATVEIDAITIIAGENNTGKSTIGKVLFSVFNAFYDIKNQIKEEKIQGVYQIINSLMFDINKKIYIYELAKYVVENFDPLKNHNDISLIIQNGISLLNENFIYENELNSLPENLINKLSEILKISDEDILKKLLNNRLYDEFAGQVNNIYFDEIGEIILVIKNNFLNIKIIDDEVNEIDETIHLKTEAIYIDDPFVVDETKNNNTFFKTRKFYDHRSNLKNKLSQGKQDLNAINEIITKNKFDLIFDKVGLTSNIRSYFLESNRKKSDKFLNIKNLSTGLKTFLIIKTLLTNATIQENGIIILDEPEIHLHPEWQLLFAELIVLIQKEFGMHILLNTHSPYFLNAIEVYSERHGISDKCKYYLATNIDDKISVITDTTNNIEAIYSKLARPFQDLENARYSND